LSRSARAKQLVKLAGGKTLLELTLERLSPVFEGGEVLIVTQEIQAAETRRVIEGFPGVKVLSEPTGKNTAACVAYAASYVLSTAGDATLALLPADHYIRDVGRFGQILSAGLDFVERTGTILTIGIEPERPATGFGYIKRGEMVRSGDGFDFFKVSEFSEKPSREVAESYLASGEYVWNAGIFLFKASVILDEIDKYLPRMGEQFRKCRSAFDGPDLDRCLNECYSKIEEISIDFGVMEKSDLIHVVPGDVGWDDVGNWDSFSKYMKKDGKGNSVYGPHVDIASENCIVYSGGQVVATLGLSDITVVATNDAILIAKRGRGEEVRDLVDLIEREGLTDLL
jgi:mannose-1-phosphate guanylyltransferase